MRVIDLSTPQGVAAEAHSRMERASEEFRARLAALDIERAEEQAEERAHRRRLRRNARLGTVGLVIWIVGLVIWIVGMVTR